jgi:uncharacterized damage-inducible protein DinB
MNSFVNEFWQIFEATQALRSQLMEVLTDADLAFSPGGNTLTLGALCRELGECEHTYVQSFKTFKHDYAYRNDEPGLETSVEKLKTWFTALDADLKAAVAGLSEEELNKIIDRGNGFMIPARVQSHIYKEALLIFYGKASIYLRALGKSMPEQWQTWIG